jgi:hypothetical protein
MAAEPHWPREDLPVRRPEGRPARQRNHLASLGGSVSESEHRGHPQLELPPEALGAASEQ